MLQLNELLQIGHTHVTSTQVKKTNDQNSIIWKYLLL